MADKTFKTPVTTFYKGQYVAPGTEITLSEAEANSIIGRHGEYGGPAPQDPGNTQSRADQASINSLNEQASINKGHGAGTEDIAKMSKAELEAEAVKRGVEVPTGSTKAEIVKLLEAKAD